ncbi:MAG: MFS transporter [Fusobacteriaceae bacterium]
MKTTKPKIPKALLALTLSSFAIGVTEFIPLGLLSEMSQFFNVSLSSMGMVVSMYAIGVAIGAPILTPKNLVAGERGSITEQLAVLKEPEVLKSVSGFHSHTISILLLIYGVAVAIGNIYGGKISDKLGAMNSLKLLFFIQVIAFGLFYFTSQSPILAVINVFVLGLLDFAIVPPLQMNVVQVAEEVAPKAIDSASGLNIAAFNLGIAGASTIGGMVVSRMGVIHTPWVAAAILSIALLMSVYEVAKAKKLALVCAKV